MASSSFLITSERNRLSPHSGRREVNRTHLSTKYQLRTFTAIRLAAKRTSLQEEHRSASVRPPVLRYRISIRQRKRDRLNRGHRTIGYRSLGHLSDSDLRGEPFPRLEGAECTARWNEVRNTILL